jgi:hypothetical protein
MTRFLLIWVVFSLAVLGGLAGFQGPHQFGATFENFGWPGGWLMKVKDPTYVIDSGSPMRVEYKARWYVLDWRSFACAALIAIALPGSVLAAVRFGLKRAPAVPTSGSSQ